MIYLGNGMYSDSGPSNELMHYGVQGMRWGHRKMQYRMPSHSYRHKPTQTGLDQQGLERRQAAAFKKAREHDGTKNPFKILTRMAIQQAKEDNQIATNEKRISDLENQMYKYHLPHIDKYHRDSKYRKKINKFNGLPLNAHVRNDDNFEHDIIDNYLISNDKEYGKLFEERRVLANENNEIKRLYG